MFRRCFRGRAAATTALFVLALTNVVFGPRAAALTAGDQYRGAILLSNQGNDVWYVYPVRRTRYFLEPTTALATLRRLAVRMSPPNLAKLGIGIGASVPNQRFLQRYAGAIVVEVQGRGKMWYIQPSSLLAVEIPASDALGALRLLGVTVDEAVIAGVPTEQVLRVPFIVQAPLRVWDADHSEFCEEASVLMAARFLHGREQPTAREADRELQRMKRWELRTFGYHFDTDADDTARMLRDVYRLNAQLAYDPSPAFLREVIDTGHPILVPTAGRLLANPHFRGRGPDYHMIVLKGYTSDGNFIANDPGTSWGASYVYRSNVIMRAMHDLNHGDPRHGRKVVIIPTL